MTKEYPSCLSWLVKPTVSVQQLTLIKSSGFFETSRRGGQQLEGWPQFAEPQGHFFRLPFYKCCNYLLYIIPVTILIGKWSCLGELTRQHLFNNWHLCQNSKPGLSKVGCSSEMMHAQTHICMCCHRPRLVLLPAKSVCNPDRVHLHFLPHLKRNTNFIH